MEAGSPQNSDILDSLLHGSEPEWAHPLHGGYSRQPDWESLLVSASYFGDVQEGCLHLEWGSSCPQEDAVDAVEVTPAENLVTDAHTQVSVLWMFDCGIPEREACEKIYVAHF